ncbi:MAG: radical SAM protein, partial [Akkermansiaceae bacterium]|nr:radical SAM protein [Akkermansiaceae bacterium]
PDRREKVLARIRETHGGALNNTVPRERLHGRGVHAAQVRQIFKATARRVGLGAGPPELKTEHFRRVIPGQGELF